MTLAVLKFGGSSIATPDRIRAAAQVIAKTARTSQVVAVVSAMGDTTDELISLAHQVSDDPASREMDMLLASGETITAPLLAMALQHRGVAAVSLNGLQAGIRTSAAHRTARIVDIVPQRVVDELAQGRVVVVAGFQGATAELDVTTLGRGGSDTTAVALAVALHAESCDILTDVPGVHTADPRLVPQARVIAEIGFGEMLELAACGAAVMHPRAVEIGEAYDLPIRVRSAFEDSPGTLICKHPAMEQRQKVRGIAQQTDVAKVTLVRVPDRPGIAATIFGELAAEHVDVDIVVQNVSHDGTTDISFTIAESDVHRARHVLQRIADAAGAKEFLATADIAKVSVVGTGLRGTPGVLAQICETLAAAGINIEMIASSEIHVTCIIDRTRTADAVQALHRAFELERI